MLTKIKTTFENGVFVPISADEIENLPERAEIEISFEMIDSENKDAAKQKHLRDTAESMRTNTFTGHPPHFSREELYERR